MEVRDAKSGAFEITSLVSNRLMKSGSISGECMAKDVDTAFPGHTANMMVELEFSRGFPW